MLNITSRKKQNTMLNVSNTAPTGSPQSLSNSPLYVEGSTGAWVLWCPTAYDFTLGQGGSPSVVNQANRTATTCYMRGLKERIRIATSSGVPWFHRRICFTNRGPTPFRTIPTGETPTINNFVYFDGSNGVERLLLNQYKNASPNAIAGQQGVLFRGQQGVDWDDPLIAKVDTARVIVKYDRSFCYRSGNANGTIKDVGVWHPMNKNLVYDDDESGDIELSGGSYWSVGNAHGMGDYYVLDIITAGTGATATDVLQFRVNSTMYWHEK